MSPSVEYEEKSKKGKKNMWYICNSTHVSTENVDLGIYHHKDQSF